MANIHIILVDRPDLGLGKVSLQSTGITRDLCALNPEERTPAEDMAHTMLHTISPEIMRTAEYLDGKLQ